MTDTLHKQTAITVDRMDDHWRRILQDALPRSEYRPFKLWTITDKDSGDSRQIRVITIKLDDHALAAAPERHLVASGPDFLEVHQSLADALIDELGIENAQLTTTCSIPFDLDGSTLRPDSNAVAKSDSQPDNPSRDHSGPEIPMTDNVADLAATPSDNLFLDAADELDLSSSDDDPNDDFQQSLF